MEHILLGSLIYDRWPLEKDFGDLFQSSVLKFLSHGKALIWSEGL